MKKRINNLISSLQKKYMFYAHTRAFERRYEKYDSKLFRKTLENDILEKYKDRWKLYNRKVEVKTFLLCYNLSGIINYDIVPENLFVSTIEPTLNSYKELSFFQVKNIYEKWFNYNNIFPKAYLHKINNIYYDPEFNIINDLNKYLNNTSFEFPLIFKPSRETFGGKGVTLILNIDDLKNNLQNHDSFICEEKIKQHDYLNQINSGVNSVRCCLYRTENDKFEVINNSIRFGINGGLDNLTAGGIVCNIHDDGKLNSYALSRYADKHTIHPNSDISFSSISIPYYNELNKAAKEIADKVPLCNLLSLDMCLDSNNQWRCLEINSGNQTIRFAQYAGKGFFGKYTDEVIKKTIKNIKS